MSPHCSCERKSKPPAYPLPLRLQLDLQVAVERPQVFQLRLPLQQLLRQLELLPAIAALCPGLKTGAAQALLVLEESADD